MAVGFKMAIRSLAHVAVIALRNSTLKVPTDDLNSWLIGTKEVGVNTLWC